MATKTDNKTRKLKPAQTVRERSQAAPKTKKRHLKATASKVTSVAKLTSKGLGMIFRPLRFILKPLQLRPVKFAGRVLAKVLLINYFAGSWKELRTVTWPDRRTTFKLTMAVFSFAVVFGLTISIVDFGLDKLFKAILIK